MTDFHGHPPVEETAVIEWNGQRYTLEHVSARFETDSGDFVHLAFEGYVIDSETIDDEEVARSYD